MILALLMGALTGGLSACGMGGGTLLLIYLVELQNMDLHLAQGINLLYFIPSALMAMPSHRKSGYLDQKLLIPSVISGLIMAVVGVFLGKNIETALVRKIFGGFLLLLGLWTWRKKA